MLPIGILIVAGLIAWVVIATSEEPQPEPREEREAVARTVEVRREPHRLNVSGRGNVRPTQQVRLFPQVSGRIEEVNPRLSPGAFVREGELLVQLEEDDFRLAVREAESNLTDARAELDLERGRQEVADEEWEMFRDRLGALDGERSGLALREPQLEVARGRVEAAEARLERAKLDLERTRIRAPFDAIVLEERASVGQLVGPQAQIADLIGANAVWIVAAVRMEQIDDIAIPDLNAEEGSEVRVWQDIGERRYQWTGRVVRLLGDLSPQGLMARVLVEVEDPFGRQTRDAINGRIPLLLDASVQLEIAGRRVAELVEISRAALREGERVFVVDADSRLSIRQPEIVWRLPRSVLARTGVDDRERVIVSPIAAPIEGLRIREENADGER